jgi:maltooligosyltrehalose trehalohydrolase
MTTTRTIGAELSGGQVRFSVWAPERTQVQLVLADGRRCEMQVDDDGYWSVGVDALPAGTRYGYALDAGAQVYADPASRFQPEGPHALSELVDSKAFAWTDAAWSGVRLDAAVIYELHVGTFTAQGTWDAAQRRLPELADLGISVIELMPVADFPGRFGWGYDGVSLYAPYHGYGRPDDLRRFIDTAHALGVSVILDVVYNHLGPDGNYLSTFCPRFFSERATEWGAALNFDGKASRPVRDFIAGNAEYWIKEFHMDGLRLDATQSIFDESEEHIIAELSRRARAAAGSRTILLIAENEPQDTGLLKPLEQGGCDLDAVWNDDLHHSAIVALLGNREAYYKDYLGRAHELVAAMKYGYLYQGQYYAWQKKRRGSPALDLDPRRFVAFLENHDQVANTARGERLRYRAQPAALRAMTALLMLGPWTPMLFQGQEFASARRFVYFADFEGKLAELVQKGRCSSLSQFPSYASRAVCDGLPAPHALETFELSKLDWDSDAKSLVGQQALALHRDLLALRRDNPSLYALQKGPGRCFDAAVLSDLALVLRYFGKDGDDLLLLVNLGRELDLTPAPEPLLGPPHSAAWALAWSSEEPRYGGSGVVEGTTDDRGWRLPAHSAQLFKPAAREPSAPVAEEGQEP